MKQFWAALASYGRVAATTIIVTVVNMGHIPTNAAELAKVGTAALFALLPVILRALNPNDKAYGIGYQP
jgi:hypothetical protein